MTSKTSLLLGLALLISGNAYTQDSLDYADTIRLDAVEVVGCRVFTSPDVLLPMVASVRIRCLYCLNSESR